MRKKKKKAAAVRPLHAISVKADWVKTRVRTGTEGAFRDVLEDNDYLTLAPEGDEMYVFFDKRLCRDRCYRMLRERMFPAKMAGTVMVSEEDHTMYLYRKVNRPDLLYRI